jgi:L-2-hydroxyglutarate oxidase LhgO
VNGLIYPVPDPQYPFLGVHFTKTVGGEVLVGPNALLALSRYGYAWGDIDVRDIADMLRWPGMWRLVARHWRAGVDELVRSLSVRAYARDAARYVPDLEPADLLPAPAGVRAQALDRDGSLVDDFRISVLDGVVAVRNAPSPAATSSLAIAERIADAVPS